MWITVPPNSVVKKIFVYEGKRVKSGDTLFILKNDKIEIDYRLSVLNYKEKERKYKRYLELYKKGNITNEKLFDIEIEKEKAYLEMKKKELEYKKLVGISPFNGFILKIAKNDRLLEDNKFVKIGKIYKVFVNLFLSSQEILMLHIGDTLELNVVYPFPLNVKGIVIGKALEPEEKEGKVFYKLKIEINKNHKLLPGMEIEVVLRKKRRYN
jgi:hypothetical protein